MDQNEIRDYNGQQFSIAEGAALVKELNDRTKSAQSGYNSIDELATKVQEIVVGSETTTIENEYADIAAMLLDQANQTQGAIQFVADASGDPNIANGYAYYEYLGLLAIALTDYRLLSQEEVTIIETGVQKVSDQNGTELLTALKVIYGSGFSITVLPGGGYRLEYAGGISDAPNDSKEYIRQNESWNELVKIIFPDAPVTDNKIIVFDGATGNKIKEGSKTIDEIIALRDPVFSVFGIAFFEDMSNVSLPYYHIKLPYKKISGVTERWHLKVEGYSSGSRTAINVHFIGFMFTTNGLRNYASTIEHASNYGTAMTVGQYIGSDNHAYCWIRLHNSSVTHLRVDSLNAMTSTPLQSGDVSIIQSLNPTL